MLLKRRGDGTVLSFHYNSGSVRIFSEGLFIISLEQFLKEGRRGGSLT